jgi:hypothetical protein
MSKVAMQFVPVNAEISQKHIAPCGPPATQQSPGGREDAIVATGET